MKKISIILNGIFKENPILFSMLGLCPALAITTKLENAIGLGMAFVFVITLSNIVISIIKNIVPNELRIPIFIVIIATFVTIIELLLNAYLPNISKNLGLYLSLLVVNCIILGRAESFASKNNVLDSMLDGIGMGIGYTLILCIISIIRELLSNGTITIWNDFVININDMFSQNNSKIFSSFFVSSAGAYLVLGILFAFINKIKRSNKNDNVKLDN